jgi:uncharacterized repeat protein (TIGR01451 family)
VAAFTTCNSGANCWKTDLDNTYDASSNQDLLSPNINLAGLVGPVVVSWAQRYQMENSATDHLFVDYQQAGGATPTRLFEWRDGTMTDAPGNPVVNIGASSGWSVLSRRADSLAGLNTELRFHLDSDTANNFGGLAVDDVSVTACQPIVGASADLAITKTDGVTTAVPGGSVTYTITASNAGPSNAPGSTVADTFPASLTCTWTCAGAGGGICTASGAGNINDTANLPAGGSVTYTASCTIAASATGTLSNTATASVAGGITDPVPGNNSATDSDTLAPSADLSITKTDGVTTAIPGGSVTYTITASDAGPSSLTCTWTCAGAGGGTCTANGAGNINDTANLPAGGSATYTASCTIAASATGTLSNTATASVAGGVTDPTPGNNSATDTDTLTPSADVSITKTDGVTTAIPGGSVTYTITASNAGPSGAAGTTVADTFPASLTCTWTCTGAGGGTCSASGSGNINDTANLPAGGSATYTASCTIASSATGTLVNTATATVAAGITDPTPGNNSATDTDTLVITADLSAFGQNPPLNAPAGGTVVFFPEISNAGPNAAQNNVVHDAFPADLTCSWTCGPRGGSSSCTPGPVNGDINDTVDLDAGGSVMYSVTCAVSSSASGIITDTIDVAPGPGVTDPDLTNNTGTAQFIVTQALSVADATVTEGNTGTTLANFAVTMPAPVAETVTVSFTTLDGTATGSDNDYQPVSGVLIFGPGETSQMISVSVFGDTNVEADETFTVVLSNPINATIADGTGLGTILNDDAITANLSIADVTVTEGNTGNTPANFVVSLDQPSNVSVSVDFATVDGTATAADNDYLPLTGTLVFSPGETSHVISVSVVGDTNVEPDETFSVVLSNPVNASILDGTGLGTIVNDDVAGGPSKDELVHDSRETRSVGLVPGVASPTLFHIMQRQHASYEVIVDAVTGDLGPNGPDLDRLDSAGLVLQSSTSATGGSSRSLRFENTGTNGDVGDQSIRVQSEGCTTDCDANDTYRIRAYETTYRISRFNNNASQVTVLIVGNPTSETVSGNLWFWTGDGTLLTSQPITIQPKALAVFNTSTIAGLAGQSGTVTVSNDAPYGTLSGKGVAVEPATGFTFDTAMVPRPATTKMVPRDN